MMTTMMKRKNVLEVRSKHASARTESDCVHVLVEREAIKAVFVSHTAGALSQALQCGLSYFHLLHPSHY
jgi:hypothetical protein